MNLNSDESSSSDNSPVLSPMLSPMIDSRKTKVEKKTTVENKTTLKEKKKILKERIKKKNNNAITFDKKITYLESNLKKLANKFNNYEKKNDPELNVYIVEGKKTDETQTEELDIKEQILVSQLSNEIKSIVLTKLKNTSVSDHGKVVQWISSLLSIPFHKFTKIPIQKSDGSVEINKFLSKRMNVLNNSVHGLEYIKEEIIEFLAQVIRNPETKGNILAFKGPPGVGKTKIIKNGISEALGRSFSVINFGGLKDSSLLDGHDSTYVGSKYGRIVQILINSKTMDPVIYLDELDKIAESHLDEISGILTHLLDEEQNTEFYDNYFQGIPIDLSKVLFVISFNDESKINNIVSDRMKIIEIIPPSIDDKIMIAKNYILPEILQNFTISVPCISIKDSVLKYIITNKTKPEDGVRSLKKNIHTIIQKINLLELVKNNGPLNISYNKKTLKNVSFPISISIDMVDILLSSKEPDSFGMMYT